MQTDKVTTSSLKMDSSSRAMASFQIRLDQKSVIYGRVASTIFTGLESIGGFLESLMHIGVMVVFFF